MRFLRRTNLARVIAALPFAAITTSALAGSPDIGPFESMITIPERVDAAAVFHNPADSILLSPVGRSMRSLLALGGVFTQTEEAWGALARTFNEPIDSTIRGLLSDQVAVVWDGIDHDQRAKGITGTFDSNWTLICKVDPEYVKQISRSLKPVKREIVHKRAVFAIEQGRYAITILEAPKGEQKATVLLAPRSGTDLLKAVLAHADTAGNHGENRPITAGHEPMLAELGAYHESLRDGTWSFIFMSRLDMFNSILAIPESEENGQTHTLAAVFKLDPDMLRCTFATDMPVDDQLPDAPIELFDAIAQESVFTVASARAPRMSVTGNSFHLDLTVSPDQTPDVVSDPIFNGPALFTLSGDDNESMGLTACFSNDRREPSQTARLSDETMRAMVSALDASQSPDFRGRFPAALRQIKLHIPPSRDRSPNDWPGMSPSLAWKTATTSEHDLTIASLAPNSQIPIAHIRRIEEAARALDALGAQPRSGVLLRVSMDPARTLQIMDDPNIMDIAITKIIRRFDLGIRRGIDTPMRGRLEIQFAESASSPKLGNDAP